ncbi:helix-turn-helix transcriptional regulator [Halorussus caseinilyticus]|uniref:Helix-turn-helix transcriptional regulator n=1 Tax=Halorussus caseinilyticus TaxID=3034025 RepID=A0ABD5WLB4_9EURY|nr:HTH domain-containing protein [Halorussus sp. DT72]
MGTVHERPSLELIVKRSHILEHVIDGTTRKSEIQKRCSESRSTVYRALEQLTEQGILAERGRGYVPTSFGKRLFREYEQYHRRATDVSDAKDILETLPDSGVPNEVFIDADIEYPNPYSPTTMLTCFTDVLHTSSRVAWLSPVLYPQYVDIWTELTDDETVRTLLLLQSEAMTYLEREDPDASDTLADASHVSLEQNDAELPFGLVVTDSSDPVMILIAHGDDGGFRGIVRNSADAAVEWARGVFADYWTGPEL